MKRACRFAVAATLALAWPSPAHAQSDRELATRQELLSQAGGLADQGKHAEALAVAKRAGAIKMTPSVRLFIAGEQSALGLLADAYGNGRQCAVEAEADTRLNSRDRILADCRALEVSLGKRVGRVTVRLPTPPPPNVHVTISGEELNAALIGEPYVVSPGKLTVAVTAPGYLPYHADVDVPEGGSPVVDVQLVPELILQPCRDGEERVHGACVAVCTLGKLRTKDEAAQCCWGGQTWSAATSACAGAPQCSNGLVAQGAECVPPLVPVAPVAPARSSSQRAWGLGVGGAGVAGVVLGSVFGGLALSALGTAEGECKAPYNSCSTAAVKERATEGTFASVSTGAFIAGGTLLAAGLILYFTAPKGSSQAVGAQLSPDLKWSF